MDSRNRLPTEKFNSSDHFRAFLLRVENEKDQSTPSIVLSRSAPEFVKALFVEQATEIKDGLIEVMGMARDPGYRTKVAVRSLDPRVDPIGACVGVRGSRIKPVIQELNGEKIDIVGWNEDIRIFAMNALAPAKIESIKAAKDVDGKNMVIATVLPENYTQAIGKHGQNVRLTAMLLGWKVKIEKTEAPKTFDEQVRDAKTYLIEQLEIDEETAETIFNLGYHSPEGIANASLEEFIQFTNLDAELAVRIWNRAVEHIDSKKTPQA